MTRQQLAAGAAMLACLAWSGAATASCECVMLVEGEDFGVHCYQTCGYTDTSYTEIDWTHVSICHVRALRFGVNLWKRLQNDSGLRGLARRSRLEFGRTYGWSDTLGREDWKAPSDLRPETVDSLLMVFREIDRDTLSTLFTVQLGVFRKRPSAVGLYRRLDDLRPAEYDEGDPDLREPKLTVDWRHSTCVYTVRPNLFVLPADAASGPWRVHFGLFVDRGDAQRAVRRLRRDHRVSGVVRALPLHQELVQAAVRQWRQRGMTDSD
jgi:hypothetical protein